jgi:hypothetical protein
MKVPSWHAFTWLDRALDDRTWSVFLLRVEPMLDGSGPIRASRG